jgi:hypothetical protein
MDHPGGHRLNRVLSAKFRCKEVATLPSGARGREQRHGAGLHSGGTEYKLNLLDP